MLKILQARLQQYMNHELLDVQVKFRKDRGTRNQIANKKKKARNSRNIYFCFTDYAKAFDCADHNKLWKILKEMGIADYLTCLLRNLYAGQKATVRNAHEQRTCSKLGKEYVKAPCLLSPCLFNLYAEHIMWNYRLDYRLDEAQAEIKTAGRNINNFRYADDITLMEESEEELKSL